jgi:hypothetical protein
MFLGTKGSGDTQPARQAQPITFD